MDHRHTITKSFNKPLSELLPDQAPTNTLPISGITNDSRNVRPGNIFFAYPGELSDGRDYIPEAIANGAAVIIYDSDKASVDTEISDTLVWIAATKVRELQGVVAARFFDDPSHQLNVIGVTGTNGKTSVTHFIAQALTQHRCACGVFGTLGNGLFPQLSRVQHTTQDAICLQGELFKLVSAGATHLVMEVSSHALAQSRVTGIRFDTAVFTQLGRDHLDYHGSMAVYRAEKEKLFYHPGLKHAVINGDDEFGRYLIKRYQDPLVIIDYGLLKRKPLAAAYLHAVDIQPENHGFQVTIESHYGSGQFFCPLLGEFNISNVLAAMGVLLQQGVDFNQVLNLCESLREIAGRMQVLGNDHQPQVVVDYAHTPDALQQVLSTLRSHCRGKLWCVFGCGGDRDTGKRAEMGKIAESLADHVVVTNDNPRTESPEAIAEAILSELLQPNEVQVILDRAEAIKRVVQSASVRDMILVAGKGHETEQIIGLQALPFNDVEQVMLALS